MFSKACSIYIDQCNVFCLNDNTVITKVYRTNKCIFNFSCPTSRYPDMWRLWMNSPPQLQVDMYNYGYFIARPLFGSHTNVWLLYLPVFVNITNISQNLQLFIFLPYQYPSIKLVKHAKDWYVAFLIARI